MGEVVNINADVVDTLRGMLADAVAGTLRAIVAVAVQASPDDRDNVHFQLTEAGDVDTFRLSVVGAVERLKLDLLNAAEPEQID